MLRVTCCLNLALAGIALAVSPVAGEPACKGAVKYAGLPLHPPPTAAQFPTRDTAATPPFNPAIAESLDAVADWILARTRAPAIAAAVVLPGQGTWSAARGVAEADSMMPLPSDPIFYWGSVGKVFTGVLVMQLIDEGKLSYDMKLATWFPDVANARWITIDMLLTHTHGLYSFQNDSTFHFTPGYSPPETLLAIAARHGPVHCPGEAWSYSNTGYVLLARILEQVEGRPYHLIARDRIVRRLGLAHTAVLQPRERPAGLVAGTRDGRTDRAFDPSVPYGAGGVAASAADMARFWQAVLTGELLQSETVHGAFARLHPMFGSNGQSYGRAVMLYDVRGPDGTTTWLGHSGGTETAKAVVLYDPTSGAFVAVAINAAAPAEAAAFRLLQELPPRQ